MPVLYSASAPLFMAALCLYQLYYLTGFLTLALTLAAWCAVNHMQRQTGTISCRPGKQRDEGAGFKS